MVVRAVGTVLLVPLVAAFFRDTPQRALVWLGWLTAATVTGWLIDTATARIGFDLGFAVLDHTQHDVADRLPDVRLDWFSAGHTATARQAIAATGPELVGLVVNLLTPLRDRGPAAGSHRAGAVAGFVGARPGRDGWRTPAVRSVWASVTAVHGAPMLRPAKPTPR